MSATKDRSCGNQSGQWIPFEKLHKNEFFEKMQELKFTFPARVSNGSPNLYINYPFTCLPDDENPKFYFRHLP